MVMIEFKSMTLSENGNEVKIVGNCLGKEINMKISILQLAKIFGTDREVGDELESQGYGSEDLEEKCHETKELVKKFPDIKVWVKPVEFKYVSVENDKWPKTMRSKDQGTVKILIEDISGWGGEGVIIPMPKEIFDANLKDKKFRVFAEPFTMVLKVEK